MDELNDPIGFWAATTCRWARIVEAPPRFLAPELAEAFRRTPSPRLDEDFPQVLPCFRLMLPDGALFTEDKVPIPVVIVADLRAMADWLPPQAQRIGGISCDGLALDGTSYLTRHSFEQIGKRNPTVDDLSHPAWQRGDLLTTGPAAKVRSGKGFAGAADPEGTVSPQGPVWIGKDFRLDRTPRAATPGSPTGSGGSGISRRPHWRRGHWHTVLHGEKRQSRRMQWFQPVYVGLTPADRS
jgi:hypothetical protein